MMLAYPILTLPSSWQKIVPFDFSHLSSFLVNEEISDRPFYPPRDLIFKAFELTAFEEVKVVILGQDPYHGEGQAEGLSFSVNENCKIPPSLRNIFKELESDLSIKPSKTGSLVKWAKQGVFLLNSTLTVQKDLAASHHKRGWEEFTDQVIMALSEKKDPIVFMLWGALAMEKGKLIQSRHLVLKAAHPSPLSAHRGFLGCRHFSKANEFLKQMQKKTINWDLHD